MKCLLCGEDHVPGDICWGDKKPEGFVGVSYDLLKLPGFANWFKRKFTKERSNERLPVRSSDKTSI
jgi:hypothetical protein